VLFCIVQHATPFGAPLHMDPAPVSILEGEKASSFCRRASVISIKKAKKLTRNSQKVADTQAPRSV